MVVPVISFRDGQETFFISSRTSVKKDFKRVHREVTYSAAAVVTFPPIRLTAFPPRGIALDYSGRPGGTRTPNPRFWRPMLYQLSHRPVSNWRPESPFRSRGFRIARPFPPPPPGLLSRDSPSMRPDLLHLFMGRMFPALSTKLAQLDAIRVLALILGRNIISVLAFPALQCDSFSHALSESEAIRFV